MTETYPIKQVYVMEILPTAMMFHDCFVQHLVPPPVGIYVRNEINPRMVPDQFYRQTVVSDAQNGTPTKAEVPLTHLDLELIETAVYNENGECVVPARLVHMLSVVPNLPVVAIKLIYELMDNRLAALQAWTSHGTRPAIKRDYDILSRYMNEQTLAKLHEEYGDLDDDTNPPLLIDLYEDMLSRLSALFQRMVSFVGRDVWSVHFMEFMEPMSVKISKSVDYRIAAWHMSTGVDVDY